MTSDRGSGTVLALVMAMLVLLGGCAAVTLARLQIARAATANAADLAALAAAGAYPGDECAAAGRIAERNDAALDRCWPDGDGWRVEVSSTPVPARPALRMRARAHAIAQL